MKTVVARIDLGFTRIAGYILYDSETYEFKEMTPVPVATLTKKGCVNGLVIDKDGELIPDAEGWNMQNIKIKSGVGHYRDYNSHTNKGDTIYSVVRAVSVDDNIILYEVINNRCARMFVTPTILLGINKLYLVGGVKITDDIITLCEGVIKEDYTDKEWFEIGVKVVSKNKLESIMENEAINQQNAVNTEEGSVSEEGDPVMDTAGNDEFTADLQRLQELVGDEPQDMTSNENDESVIDENNTDESEGSQEMAQTMEELFGDTGEISGSMEDVEDAEDAEDAVSDEAATSNTDNKSSKSKKKHHKK